MEKDNRNSIELKNGYSEIVDNGKLNGSTIDYVIVYRIENVILSDAPVI